MNTTASFSPFVVSEIQLRYQPSVKPSARPKINSSADAYNIFLDSWDDDLISLQEQFKIMLLNRSSRVLGIVPISTGSMTGTTADPKLIFAAALKAGACAIVLAHNHPSGQLAPSPADLAMTRQIKAGGALLDIIIADHLILGDEDYYSFADSGTL